MTNYIDKIANRIHEIADADPRVQRWWGGDGSPMTLLRAYAGLVLVKGEAATLEDVHNTWAAAVVTLLPSHPCLVPISEVPISKQEFDGPYLDTIHAVARELS